MTVADKYDTDPVDADEGGQLTWLAARTVRQRLLGLDPAAPPPTRPALLAPGASFVTLTRAGQLRGCIGTLRPVRPLYQDVSANTVRAMRDPRLAPVDVTDWPELDVSVSVLTTPQPLAVEDRAALLDVLRPGVDGLLITDGDRRATFLPAVWEKLPDPVRFLDQLLVKGGWAAGSWPRDLWVGRYRAVEFTDAGPRVPLTGRPAGPDDDAMIAP